MKSIVIDCDPGCDDVLAILLALRHSHVKGITTVGGNVPLAQTTTNALMVVALANAETPVFAGANPPPTNAPVPSHFVHGSDGLGNFARVSHSRSYEIQSATEFLLDCVTSDDWVVAIGPLTNIGEVLDRDPGWGKRIGGISIMGGSSSAGNVTPAAEFNVYIDPHAAAKVYASGANLKVCGLNLTHQLQITDATVRTIDEMATRQSTFASSILNHTLNSMSNLIGTRRAPLHDPCAVLAVTHPSLFDFEELSVQVETDGSLTRGMTVIDQRTTRPRLVPNAFVAQHINAARALDVIVTALGSE